MELTRGHKQLEDKQLLSTMAANEEDMLEGILLRNGNQGKGNDNNGGMGYYSILAPLSKQCYTYRNEPIGGEGLGFECWGDCIPNCTHSQ